jgi:hypothetical protein
MPMQAQTGGGGISSNNSQPVARRWVVSIMLRPLYPQNPLYEESNNYVQYVEQYKLLNSFKLHPIIQFLPDSQQISFPISAKAEFMFRKVKS